MNLSMKTVGIALLFVFSFQVQAQLTYGIKAGLNMSNIKQDFKVTDREDATKMKIGFHIGAVVDYEIADMLSLQSGLLISSKGFNYDLEDDLEEGESVDGYDKTSYTYLEIPIHAAYKINDSFQLYAGPYVAFGIAGKNSWDYTYKYGDDSYNEKDDYTLKPMMGEIGSGDLDDDEGAYNGLDYGFDIGLGYQVGPALINAGYSIGLGNMLPNYKDSDYRDDNSVSNRVISISATYFFGE